MTTSRADIVILALEALNVNVTPAPSSEDYDRVNKRIPRAIDELAARDVITLQDTEEFDDGVAAAFADYLAAYSSTSFAMDQIGGLRSIDFRLASEQRLRRIRQTQSEDFVIPRDYF